MSTIYWLVFSVVTSASRLLNVLEVIAPFKHFNKLREFVQMKLPPGFPVKLGKWSSESANGSLEEEKTKTNAVFSKNNLSWDLFDFLQTSPSSRPLQRQWRFRSFAMMTLTNRFLLFPKTIKKIPPTFLTFNLSVLKLQQYPIKHTFPNPYERRATWDSKLKLMETSVCITLTIAGPQRHNLIGQTRKCDSLWRSSHRWRGIGVKVSFLNREFVFKYVKFLKGLSWTDL